MNDLDLSVVCASWEDRFRLGFIKHLASRQPRRVLMYSYDGSLEWTAANRDLVTRECAAVGIAVEERQLSASDYAANWNLVREDIARLLPRGGRIHVDISTMPRELIWTMFWLSQVQLAKVEYTYNAPQQYNSEWLSRDPARPRLIFKLSGIARLEARTLLVVVTGYDQKRTAELIRFYEPERALIGLQLGDVNLGNVQQMEKQRAAFSRQAGVSVFDIDAFSADRGEETLRKNIEPYLKTHNIVISSLGPKLSAVAVYRLHRKFPEIGIAYAPSREFNREYSSGLGRTYEGAV